MTTDRLLRRREVENIVGLGKTSLYKQIQAGVFPQPVQVGSRAVRWRESEIIQWLGTRETGTRQDNLPKPAEAGVSGQSSRI